MEWWQILILILLILAVLYLFAASICMGMAIVFKEKLKENTKALSIIMTEQKSLLLLAFERANRQQWEIEALRNLETEELKEENISSLAAVIRNSYSRLEYDLNKKPTKEKRDFKENYGDLSANYAQVCANYNSAVIGYNYWIKVPLASLLPHIAGYRKKEPLK